MAPHHRRVKLVSVHLALGRDQHVADHAQALHIRVERAQAVGELFRQHGNHAARKVHAGGPVVGFNVNGRPVFHVMAHVGNGHQQTPAFAAAHLGGLAVHGVVKIAGVFAVNGDQGHVGQVYALELVGRPNCIGQGPRQRQASVAEFVRHTVFAHCNFNFHAGIVNLAQHLFNPAHRLAKQRWRLGEFHHHHLPGLGRPHSVLGDQHILAVALVLRGHQPHAAFMQQATNDGVGRALQNLGHTAFGAALAILPHDAGFDPVAVQHSAHFIGRQVKVGLTVVALHKTMAVAVARYRSLKFGQRSRRSGAGVWRVLNGDLLLSLRVVASEGEQKNQIFSQAHQSRISMVHFTYCPDGGIGRRTSFRY